MLGTQGTWVKCVGSASRHAQQSLRESLDIELGHCD